MTTQVVNIEDTLPYVEPPVVHSDADIFRNMLEESADTLLEAAAYHRDRKDWARAMSDNVTRVELVRIAKMPDPEKELQTVMDRMAKLYMELTITQRDCRDAVDRNRRRNAPVPTTLPPRKELDAAADRATARVLTDAERSALIRERTETARKTTQDVRDRARIAQAKAEADVREAGRNRVQEAQARNGRRKGPVAVRPKVSPAAKGTTTG